MRDNLWTKLKGEFSDAREVTVVEGSNKNKKPTIYIIEEDDIVRDGLVRLCNRLDVSIRAYTSLNELLAVERPRPPGCVVAEINLPENDGTHLLQRIRNSDVCIPVIFLSSGSDIETAVEVMREGAFDFIEKPFLSRILLHRIDEAVIASV